MTKPRYLSLAFIILLVLMFAAARPYAVFADDETPPTPEPTEVPVATDTPTAETPSTEEAPSPAEIIEQLPEGTELVVLDENGEAISLVTEQAAEILAAGDPYFTIGTTTYRFFGSGGDCSAYTLGVDCFISAGDTPIQDAIDYLSMTLDTAPDNGNIYVEADIYTENVIVDGGDWTSAPSFLGLIGNSSGDTFIEGSVEIYNMNAFTLSGFSIVDVAGPLTSTYVTAAGNSGLLTLNDLVVENDVNGAGIYVFNHSGDISFTEVYSSDNLETGAYLNNGAGSGSIDVSISDFSNNGEDGLIAYSGGTITLSNVSADWNNDAGGSYYAGAYLEAVGNIIIDEDSSFSDNYFDGLTAFSDGSITLTDVTAIWNNDDGGNYNTGATLGAAGDISIDNSEFSDNYLDGLVALSDGSITLNDVTVLWNNYDGGNFYAGAYLETDGDGDISIEDSEFSHNYYDGLIALSDGAITVTDVTADWNNDYDCGGRCASAYLEAVGNIFIDPSSFSDNYLDGLVAISGGTITLTNVTANGNNGAGGFHFAGAFLEANGNISVDPSSFSYNYWDGLLIGSDGNVTLIDVTADYNDNSGASIETLGSVWVGQSQFNNNAYFGLDVDYAYGQITLQGVTGNENGYAGAALYNNLVPSTPGVTVTDSVFNGNDFGGVGAFSDGDILLDHVTADGNVSGTGLFTTGTVTVTCSSFTNNSDNGMDTDTPTLILNSVNFAGNATDYYFTGSVFVNSVDCDPGKKALPPFPSLPLNEVQVTGGEGTELNCSAFRGTVLILPNGDSALFPCPLQDSASLASLGADALPGDLPDGNTFGSAFTAGVEKNGSAVSTLDSSITLSFVIPDGMSEPLAILFWDGSAWVELSGHSVDGHFEASTNHTGTFVLVSK